MPNYRQQLSGSLGAVNACPSCGGGGTPPSVVTDDITDITDNLGTATSGGKTITSGSEAITVKGVQWSSTSNFSSILGTTSDGAGTATYVSNITGLNSGTVYYVRAYVTSSVATAYGQVETFISGYVVMRDCLSNLQWNVKIGVGNEVVIGEVFRYQRTGTGSTIHCGTANISSSSINVGTIYSPSNSYECDDDIHCPQ